MNIILGADGHVGSVTAKFLLQKGENVLVVLHSDKNESDWHRQGAETTLVDVNNTEVLKSIFNKGERAFILNPPAPISTDTVNEEKKSVSSILKALKDSGITKIVAESTYGAQPGHGIGDLGVLYEMEQGLAKIDIPTTIIRAAYYMSNWEMQIESAIKEGVINTLYPTDFKLPMVSPNDIGKFAGTYLQEPVNKTGLHYIEGPEEIFF